jgi:hypothetical protein
MSFTKAIKALLSKFVVSGNRLEPFGKRGRRDLLFRDIYTESIYYLHVVRAAVLN